MKNLSKKYLLLIFNLFCTILLGGCFAQEEFDLEPDANPPIIIHALITNQAGPYYVQVSRATNEQTPSDVENALTGQNYTPITNATITLTDDQGNIDILEPYAQDFPAQNAQGVITFAQIGYYRTSTNIQGVPGRTYTLTVQHAGKSYQATATMPPTPPAITVNHGPFIYPLLNFSEPQEKGNYYMFFHRDFFGNDPINSRRERDKFEDNLWPLFYQKFQIYSDQFWGNEVKDLDIYTPNYLQKDSLLLCFECPENIQVQMHSISKEAYEFYNALNQQARNDGGTFHTEPATPPSNFSNGALGIFRASAVQSITAPIKY